MEMINDEIKEILRTKILKLPNVTGFSIYLLNKRIKGVEVNIPSIKIYVSRKVRIEELKPEDIIPREINGIPTDVEELPEMKALKPKYGFYPLPKALNIEKTKKIRPLKAGVSIGHKDITAGTLGYFVKKNGKEYILSNNHVLACSNKGKKGDEIVQQGMYDIPDKNNWRNYVCGYLEDFIPISFNSYTCPFREAFRKLFRVKGEANHVDVAIASIEVPFEVAFLDTDIKLASMSNKLEINDIVWKTGRTTCLKNGIVRDLGWCGTVAYDRGIAYFEDQILIQSLEDYFSQGGDSGSVICKEDRMVGLLFAGGDSYTIANKVKYLEEWGIGVITS